MIQVTATSVTTTLDETAGLQNATATPVPAGDADDNDILASSLPDAFSDRLDALWGQNAPAAIGAALSGYTGAVGDTGSNVISVTGSTGATITDLGFVDGEGAPLNGLDSDLDTVDGDSIFLYTDSGIGGDNNIVLGRAGDGDTADPDGAIVFALYLDETGSPVSGGKIWSVQYSALKNTDPAQHDDFLGLANKVFVGASQDLEFSLTGVPSGQNLFLMFTVANPTTEIVDGVTRITDPAIIATGKDPANESTGVNVTTGDTVNTSQASSPTTFGTNSQMITEQEGIRFSFVTGARQDVTIPNLEQTEAKVEANIDFTAFFDARSATFDVVQLQSGKSAQVKITAFSSDNIDESGVNFVDGYADDTTIGITNVTVVNASGAAPQITYNSDGSATITGVEAGDKITYTTVSDHNRVLIENGAPLDATGNTHADFDIGGFRLLQVTTDTAEVGSKVRFEDDGPSIDANAESVPVLTTDDTEIPDTAGPVSFAGLFTSAFGTDGFKDADDNDLQDADAIVYSLGVSGVAAASGLVDTLSGDAVVLNKVGDDIVGTAGAGGPEVVRITVDAAGNVTLLQSRSVVHDDPLDPEEAGASAAGMNPAAVTLTATITDGDLDTDTATRDIGGAFRFEDDGPSISVNNMVKLDDDALIGGNPGGPSDDIDAENVSGTLAHSFGTDGAGSIAYLSTGAPAGFTYEADPNNNSNLLVKQGATTVLTLTLNSSTGAYTVTQNAPIMHVAGLEENNQSFTINYRVTDGDDDTVDGTLSINVDDDTPTLDFGNLAGTGTIAPQYGEWSQSVGADQPGDLDISLEQFQLVRPDGTVVNGTSFNLNGLGEGSLTGDFDNNAGTDPTTVNFTLTALNDGRYIFDLEQGFGSTITTSTANGTLDAGGPDPVRTLTISPDEQVVFFGVQATTADSELLQAVVTGENDLTEEQIQSGGFSFLGAANMNVSTSGIGIGNNNLDGNTTAGINAGDESFIVNPETLLTSMRVFIDNSVGGYIPATEELYYKIFYDDGSTSGNIKVLSGDLKTEKGGQVSFAIDGGSKLIDSVQLTMGKGTVKIPVIEFTQSTENLASDIRLDLTASLTDADSDIASSNFSIDLFANDLGGPFDYTLVGASSDLDGFDVDLSADEDSYRIEGFDKPADTLFLLGNPGASVSINNSGTDSIVSVAETGGQTTVITVVGVDLVQADDIVLI